jgi:lipopolysaccharide heptosyltransferase II
VAGARSVRASVSQRPPRPHLRSPRNQAGTIVMAADDNRAAVPENSFLEADAGYDLRPPFDARLAGRAKLLTKRRGQWLLRLALGAVGYATRTRARTTGDPPRRILVVRVDLLGDVVLSLPAVRALGRAYPEADIDLLVLQSTAGILEGQPGIHRVLAYDPHVFRQPASFLRLAHWLEAAKVLRTIRASRYDLAVSISGDMGSILTRLSGAKRRFGYSREAYQFFLTNPLPGGRYLTRQHETEYVLALARAAGGIASGPDDARPRLVVVPWASLRVSSQLREGRASLGRTGPVVTLHGGARNGQAKRWPTGHFARLAERLIEEFDALVVLTGAGGEAQLAGAIQEQCRRYPLLNLAGKTSLPELSALLSASDLVISGDSGPMHIACAVGTPVISLHGPTDPLLSGPTAVSADAIVLRKDLWCSPCYDARATAECPFGNPVCMKSLQVDLVFGAARDRLVISGYTARNRPKSRLYAVSKGTHYAATDTPDFPAPTDS